MKSVVAVAGIGMVVLALGAIPYSPASDWDDVFRPAALALVRGDDPYTIPQFFNPPWALFPLVPFAVLPYNLGRGLMLLAGIVAFGLAARRMGAGVPGILVFATAPLVFNAMMFGNVEWLAVLGLVAVPPVGILLLMIKPHMTIAIAAFLFVEAWRARGWKAAAVLAGIAVAALVLSVVWFGFWPLKLLEYNDFRGSALNVSFMPYSLPVGLALAIAALRTRRLGYAVAASPCFFAVLTPQVWIIALLAIAGSTPELIAATLGLWGIVVWAHL